MNSGRKEQRKACKALRRFLTPPQLSQMDSGQLIRVVGSCGGVYGIDPYRRHTYRLKQYGSRWYKSHSYCIHDRGFTVPPADLALTHLLWLRSDEERFLDTANATQIRNRSWNLQKLQRMNRKRWGKPEPESRPRIIRRPVVERYPGVTIMTTGACTTASGYYAYSASTTTGGTWRWK